MGHFKADRLRLSRSARPFQDLKADPVPDQRGREAN